MKLKLAKTLLSIKPSPTHYLFTLLILSVLVSIFILPLAQIWSANGHEVFEKREYWRAFTTTFIHADMNHLVMNAVFFTGLTLLYTTYFGWMFYPVATFLSGGIINMLVLSFYPPQVSLVGISGVIYFMAALWLTFYIMVEKRISLGRRLINSVAIGLIFLFPQTVEKNVSYSAHAIGFVLGIPTGISYYLVNKTKIRSYDVWVEVPEDEEIVEFEDENLS